MSVTELCESIRNLCSSDTVPEDDHLEIDPEVVRKRAKQLAALADALEAASSTGHTSPRVAAQPVLCLGGLALALATCFSWWPALSFNFDGGFFMDDAMIRKNPNVYEPLDIMRIMRTDYWGLEMFQEGTWTHKSFRPLTVLTFRLNYWLHTFESSGFHIANVVLHTISSVLLGVFGISSLGLPVDWSTLLAGAFFAHPVHTESVLYIVGRADLLCLILVLLAAVAYSPCTSGRIKSAGAAAALLTLSTLLLVAAGLCKETWFCFFGLLVGWEVLGCIRVQPGSTARRWCYFWRACASFAVGAVACYWRLWYTGGTGIERMDPQSNPIAAHSSRFVRALSYALVHGVYGKLLVWPSFLCYDYSLDAIPLVFDLDDVRLLLPVAVYSAFASIFVLSLRSLAIARRSRASEAPIIGAAILILSFVPMANVLFPVGTMIGERLLYIPSAGLLICLSGLGHIADTRSRSRSCGLLFLAAGLAGAWRCHLRVPEWQSAATITAADGMRQLRSSRVQFNFGNLHLQEKRYDEALATYQRAIDVDEQHSVQDALPLYHAGQVLFYQGNYTYAVNYLEKAVTGYYSPLVIKEEEVFHDYALALWFMERPHDSILNFQKTLAINPSFTKALNNMACAMGIGALTGKLPMEYYEEAIQALDQAVKLEPSSVLYWRNAVALMSFRGDTQRAEVVLQQLVAADPAGRHADQPPTDCSWEFYFR